MTSFKVNDTQYYTNSDGLIMFSLKKNIKDTDIYDPNPRGFWLVKQEYPHPLLGFWKFRSKAKAIVWIKREIEVDTKLTAKKLEDIFNAKSN